MPLKGGWKCTRMKKEDINKKGRILFDLLILLIDILNKLYRYVELLFLKRKYANIKFFKKGSGGLSKFIIKDKGLTVLYKKNNKFVDMKLALFNVFSKVKTPTIQERLSNLKSIIKIKEFNEVNVCYKITKGGMFSYFIESAETLNEKNFSKEKMLKVKKAIDALHEKGYYYSDLSISNIIVDKKNIYLVDIESIEPALTESDKRYDYTFLLKSIKDQNLKKRIKKVIENGKSR